MVNLYSPTSTDVFTTGSLFLVSYAVNCSVFYSRIMTYGWSLLADTPTAICVRFAIKISS